MNARYSPQVTRRDASAYGPQQHLVPRALVVERERLAAGAGRRGADLDDAARPRDPAERRARGRDGAAALAAGARRR